MHLHVVSAPAANEIASKLPVEFLEEASDMLPQLSAEALDLALVYCMIKRWVSTASVGLN